MSSSLSVAANTAGDDAASGEEGILVAIRMRPLNSRESGTQNSRVWRVLQKYNSVTQCTSSGKPLPERIQNRNFFTYDKTFGEASSTRQVYEDTSRGIVDSVANGLNGTIFAYGQTSSGKTFTMQGSGTLQEGATGSGGSVQDNGGIVHMAAGDIFNHIEKDPERVFLVRVSFIEIYNEEVRDLLVSGESDSHLTIREDKRRGVFVNSNETIVTSMDSMLSVLFAGEKNRSVASTGMNERSSRSHTIFKITVESRLKQTKKNGEDDDDDEEESDEEEDMLRGDDNKNNGAVRVSTLNLVDLAGSESVRHTGATGDRQKEGGKINQSLLTLSRVIGSLGQGAAHINFRDSKLTRILQPSLSGNARMAVICCATPSELYIEETRSTLQFASRAKLVKTRAQVNEVIDDRSLIKKLQRELKEARMGGPGKDTMEQIKVLEEKAASAEYANRKTEEDLKRVKKLILKGGVLPDTNGKNRSDTSFVYNESDDTINTEAGKFSFRKSKKSKSKRRYSDGVINETENVEPQQGSFSSPARGGNVTKLQAQTEKKPKKSKTSASIIPSAMGDDRSRPLDVSLLREALAAKSSQVASLKATLDLAAKEAKAAANKLQYEQGEKEMLRLAKQELESQVSTLASDKEFVLSEQDIVMADKENMIATSLEKIENMLEERKQQAYNVAELQTLVESLQRQLAAKEVEHGNVVETLTGQMSRQQEDATVKLAKLEGQLEATITSNIALTDQVSSLQNANNDAAKILSEKEAELEEATSKIVEIEEEMVELRNGKVAVEEKVSILEEKIGAEQSAAATKLVEMEYKLEAEMHSNTELTEKVLSLQNTSEYATMQLTKKEAVLEEFKSAITTMKEEASAAVLQLSDKETEFLNAKKAAEESISTLKDELDTVTVSHTQLADQVQSLQKINDDVAKQLSEKEAALEESKSTITSMEEASAAAVSQLENRVSELNNAKLAAERTVATLKVELEAATATNTQLSDQVLSLQSVNDDVTGQLREKETALEKSTSMEEASAAAVSQLENRVSELSNAKLAAERTVATLEVELEAATATNTQLSDQVMSLQSVNDDVTGQLREKETALEKSESTITTMKEEASAATSQLSEEVVKLQNAIQVSEETVAALKDELEAAITSRTQLSDQVESLQKINDDVAKQLSEKEAALEESNSNIAAMKEDASSASSQLANRVSELSNAKLAAEKTVATLEVELEAATATNTQLSDQVLSLQKTNGDVAKQLKYKEIALEKSESTITTMEEASSAATSQLSEELAKLQNAIQVSEETVATLEGKLEAATTSNTQLSDQVEASSAATSQLSEEVAKLQNAIQVSEETVATLEGKLEAATTSNTQLSDQVESLQKTNDDVAKQLSEKEAALEELKEDASSATSQLSDKLAELRNVKQAGEEIITSLDGKLEAATITNTQLSNQVASLRIVNDDVTSQLREKEIALNNSISDVAAMKEASSITSQLSKELNKIRDEKVVVEELVSTLEKALEAEQLATQELERQLENAEEDIVRLVNENNTSNEIIQDLQSNLANMTRETEVAMDSLQTTTTVEEALRKDISKLEATILHANQAATTFDEKITLLECEVSTLSSKRDELAKELESRNEELLSMQTDASDSSFKMQELQCKIEEFGAQRDTAQERVEELISEMININDEMAALRHAKENLASKLEIVESERDECLNEAEAAIDDKEKMMAEIEAMETKYAKEIESLTHQFSDATLQITELTSQLSDVSTEKKELETKTESISSALAAMQDEVSKLESSIESLTAERDGANEQVSQLKKSIAEISRLDIDKEEVISKLSEDLDELKSKNSDLKSAVEAVTTNYNAVEAEQKHYMEKLGCATGENQKLEDTIANLEVRIQEKSEEFHSTNVQIAQLTQQVSTLTKERDELTAKVEKATVEISELQSTAGGLAAQRDNAEARAHDMLSKGTKFDEEKSAIHSEKKALEAQVEGCFAQLDLERAEMRVKIDGLNTKIAELQSGNESLANDLHISKTEMNELLSQAEKSEANYEEIKSEKEECLNQLRDEMSTIIANLQKSLAEKSQEITQLNVQLNTQVSVSSNQGVHSNDVDLLKKEIIELKSLLSSANASVDEARSAALLADEELEEKELQLENALRNLAEQEEAHRIAEDKLRLAELSPRNSLARTDSEEELLRDMEVLMGEKIDAESRLEQELSRREDIEDELRKITEEEKQLLIDEAESKMISLRDEISQLKSDLSRVESDCYNMKDENADLQDKLQRIEAKATDSESIVTTMNEELSRKQNEKTEIQERLNRLEEESAAFKSQVFAAKNDFEVAAQAKFADVEEQLNDALSRLAKSRNEVQLSRETISDLSSDIEQYRTELSSVKEMASNSNDIELSKLREELAQTKFDISQEKAKYSSVKRDLETAKEKIDRIKRHEHEKQQKFASKAREAIETLKDRLAKAESAQKVSVANNEVGAEVERLQKEIKDLKNTLRDKDDRIKKLERSKITKSQIANIQKLKDERMQFMAEAKEYKVRVEELENQNLKPRRSGLRERKDPSQLDQSKTIEKLQGEIRQCESKLRKYVEHSDRLENERKGVIEAISSCDVGGIVGDGMVEMVVSLCDKLASIEEECDVLASSEGKAAEYLAELDSLRAAKEELEEKFATLEKQVQSHEENVAECKANLKKAEAKIVTLTKDKESLQAMAESAKGNISELQSERRRQLHHLSNENLQLGDELKRTKKDLAETKAELDAIQKNAFSCEHTEELEGLSNLLGSSVSTIRAPMESANKSGSKRIPLGPSRKRCSESPVKKQGSKDKENSLNKKQRTLSTSIQSPFSSAKKKRSTNPFSSVKKAARRTKKALTDDSPTKQYVLGDSEPTADVTGECNQS